MDSDTNFNSTFITTGNLIKKSFNDKDEADRMIKGYASCPVVDIDNEVISTSAYNSAIKAVKDRMQKGRPIPMFIEHRRKELSLPVGSVVDAGQDEKGLWFKGKIAKGNIGDSVWDLIRQNILYSVSMGGDATKKSRRYDSKIGKDITVIDDMIWRELSLTGLPVNEEAVFSIAKSMGTNKKDTEKFTKEVEKSLNKLNRAIDFEKSLHSIQETNEMLEKAIGGENADLNEDQLNKIAESMKTLARLLGIQSDFSTEGGAPGQGPEQPQDEQNPDEQNPMGEQNLEEQNPMGEQNPEEQGGAEQPEEAGQKPNFGQKVKTKKPIKPIQGQEDAQTDVPEEQLGAEPNADELGAPKEEETVESGKKKNPFMKKKKQIVADEDQDEGGKAIDNNDMDIQKDEDGNDVEGGDRMSQLEKKVDEMHKIITKQGGEKSMDEELIKCDGCGATFEKSEYDVNYCPKCGTDLLEKAEDEDEDDDEDEDSDDEDMEKSDIDEEGDDDEAVFCKSCNSFFEKAAEYDMSYCPKCGKSVVAVAPSPRGADTKYGMKTSDKVAGTEGSVAVAPEPKGATTKWKKAQRRMEVEKNLTVDNPEKTSAASVDAFEGNDYIDSISRKQEASDDNSTLHDFKGANYQPFAGKIDEGKTKTYGVAKSEDSSRLDRIEKALEAIATGSVGKKSRIESTVEKSAEVNSMDSTRFLARTFLGKL